MAEGLVLNKMYKNKDYNAVFTFSDGKGNVLDLTDYDITFVARKISKSPNVIVSALDLATFPLEGKGLLKLDPADTDVDLGSYEFQLVGSDDQNEEHMFNSGTFMLKKSFL